MGNIATNGDGEAIVLDAVTHYVHSGFMRGFYNEDVDLDTGENLDTLIVIGSKPVHIVLDLQAFGGQLVASIYEGCQYSATGTQLRTSRFNRVINLPVEMMVYTGPTITNVGDEFVRRRVLAHAQGNSGITSSVSTGVGRVFKPYTAYLLRQTAVSDNISLTLVGLFREG